MGEGDTNSPTKISKGTGGSISQSFNHVGHETPENTVSHTPWHVLSPEDFNLASKNQRWVFAWDNKFNLFHNGTAWLAAVVRIRH